MHLIPAIFLSEGTPPVNASDDNNIPKPDCGSYSIYDDFNDTAYSGSFNRNKWEPFSSSAGRIVQKNGMLTLSRTKGISDGIGLTAHEYQDFTLKNSFFLEAKLMVSEAQEGHVYLTISSDLDSEDYADCILGYGDKQASIGCSYSLLEEKEEKAVYKTLSMSANYGTWHIVRIDIETSTMTFTYHMDGQRIGSYVSKNAKKLKQAKFSIDIGVWGESTETVTGYIDYVCIGEIEQ